MSYVPDRGDLVTIDFNPQAGHEQAGRRPALVISPQAYNSYGLALMCPITNQAKSLPFEVPVPTGLPISGVVLSDHIKSLDWRARKVKLVQAVAETHEDFVTDVLAKIETLTS